MLSKEEFLTLVARYSHETVFLSYHDYNHPAYLKLKEAGTDIVPWLLERLRDSIGHDAGDAMDYDNDPWLCICLLGELTDCMKNFPEKYAGRLNRLRAHILLWDDKQRANKNAR